MKNGRCPQCGSTTVYSRPGGLDFGNMDRIFINTPKSHKPSTTTALVCVTCGYIEIYLTERSYLAEVAQSWSKVPVKT